MRLAVNGFFHGQPNTGSGQYVARLLEAMASSSDHEIVILRPRWPGEASFGENEAGVPAKASTPELGQGVEASAGKSTPGVEALAGSGPITTYWLPVPFKGNIGKLWFEQVAVPLAARRLRADLLHVPYLGSPLFSPCPVVVTVHDLIMKILPAYRGSWGVRQYTRLVCAAAKRANAIVADSVCTKADIVRLLGVASDRIRVVYLGCDERFRQRPGDEDLSAVRRKYGLGDRYILYIGGLDSRKNVVRLIQAFGRLGGGWELAIAGRPHSDHPVIYPALDDALRSSGAFERIKLLGFVPEEDKPGLYSAASLFVYPSLYEGFGLPPLEALACGTPVMCSNTSSLPEVVGTAAVLVAPHDCDAMVQCMRAILECDEFAGELRRLAIEQVRQFTWQRTADDTLAVYVEVLSASRH